jgi:putative ABC transport system ATP-binding protein
MLSLLMENISVAFPGLSAPALAVEKLEIPRGARVAITGASGSGKSTLINVLTGLERVRQGRIEWDSTNLVGLSESRCDRWRGRNVGLVMQEFHLFAGLSALDNVLLPLRLSSRSTRADLERARALLARAGLSRPHQHVESMSRGEMQRVAIARALLRKPGVIIADEPTASLDAEGGETAGRLLLELAQEEGSTLIVASHDMRLAAKLDRHIKLSSGRIVSDSIRTEEVA